MSAQLILVAGQARWRSSPPVRTLFCTRLCAALLVSSGFAQAEPFAPKDIASYPFVAAAEHESLAVVQ